jgi:thiol-disulfide isomerase/thioredoxin
MKHQNKFKKKYKVDAIDFVEKADLEFFGLAKSVGIQSVLKSYAEKKEMNIEFNDEFNKDLVEAFAEAGKKFPYNEKISFNEDLYQLEPTPINPSVPKSKGVLEDFKDIVGDDPFREQFNGVYVSNDGYLYSTDAHKLIRYKNNDYSEYEGKLINLKTFILSKGKKIDFIDAKPLQYESVIPKNNSDVVKNLPTYNFYNFSKSVIALKKLLSNDIFNVIFDFKGESFGFNPILMSDVFHFALCKGFDTFTLEYSTPNRAIIFNFKDNSLGLLMPIMVKDDSLMGTTKTTIEQIVSDYGYSKSMPKAKSEKATKVEVKEVPYTKFDGTIKDTTYIPRRDISYVVLKNGEQLSSSEIADGVYKINKKMAIGGGVGEYKLNDNVDFYYGRADEKKVISGTISDILKDGYTISTGFTQVMVKPSEIVGYSKQVEPKKKTFGIFKDGGEVEFIEYKDEEIMYEPTYDKYYTNDEEFDTLKQAQNYIDKGSPMSAKTINAYRKGAFKDGGAVGNEIAEIKAKIEKAKKNTIMPENLKKQYIEKYEKQLAALTLNKGTKEDVKDFLEVPKGKTPKIVKVEPKGKVKLKEILIHWAEGDNSKYDKFPKKYKTWEAANKAIIPVYEDYAEEGGGGYNKVKFTVTFDDNENYDGRLDVSTKEDNPTKTHNVIGQHIKDYLDYQLSEKSRTSEAVKKEILEWLEKYDLGLEKIKQTVTKKPTPKKETITTQASEGRTERAIGQDKKRLAKKAGKRISENGNVYYESRENRSDKNQKTRLENGGVSRGWKHKK